MSFLMPRFPAVLQMRRFSLALMFHPRGKCKKVNARPPKLCVCVGRVLDLFTNRYASHLINRSSMRDCVPPSVSFPIMA